MSEVLAPDGKPLAVGQVWMDTDKRQEGMRFVTIERIDAANGVVYCSCKTRRGLKAGPSTKIKISRLKPGSTGYRRMEDL